MRLVVLSAAVTASVGENKLPIIEGVTRLTIVQFQRMRKGEREPAVCH